MKENIFTTNSGGNKPLYEQIAKQETKLAKSEEKFKQDFCRAKKVSVHWHASSRANLFSIKVFLYISVA